MERKVVKQEVLQVIENVTDISQNEIRDEDALMDDLDVSSLEILTIIGRLEEIYSIEIKEKDMRNIVTIKDMVECISHKIDK